MVSSCFSLPPFPSLLACLDGGLRLLDGPTPDAMEGRVEICFDNVYGSICHDLWNDPDARVVCTQLGFNSEGAHALINAPFDISSGPIYLDDVNCVGDESFLVNCSYDTNTTDCTHDEDAGVRCLRTYMYNNRYVRMCIYGYNNTCICMYMRSYVRTYVYCMQRYVAVFIFCGDM